MLDYMIMPFRRYADFTGRSRRMEFWAFSLLNVIVTFLISILVMATGGSLAALANADEVGFSAVMAVFFGGFGLLFVVWWLVTIIPSIAVTVRRLHDRDMSGWWYLGFVVASFIPFVGFVAGIVLFVLLVLPGTRGSNRFGPDPKEPVGPEVFG